MCQNALGRESECRANQIIQIGAKRDQVGGWITFTLKVPYKVLAKVLENRIKKLAERIVRQKQTGVLGNLITN